MDFWDDPTTRRPVCFDWRKGGIADVSVEVAERAILAGAAEALTPQMIAERGSLLVKRSRAAGDLLLLTPLLAALKAAAPGMEIDVLCRTEYAPVLAGNPALRRVYRQPGEAPDFRGYGLVADFDGWPERQPGGRGENRAQLCADYFGLKLERTRPYVYLSVAERESARGSLRPAKGKLVGIFLEAEWPSRTWAGMKETAALFSQAGYATLVFGQGHNRAEDWRQLLAMIAACDLIVTPDSGPLHAATGLGIPTVAVFLSTDPAALVGADCDVTALRGESCEPCWRARCQEGEAACSLEVTPAQVFAAGQKRLARVSSGGQEPDLLISEGQRLAVGPKRARRGAKQ